MIKNCKECYHPIINRQKHAIYCKKCAKIVNDKNLKIGWAKFKKNNPEKYKQYQKDYGKRLREKGRE